MLVCRRRGWYQPSVHSKIAWASWVLVPHRWVSRSSRCIVDQNDSITALFRVVNCARSSHWSANCSGDSPVPPVGRARVRVPGRAADVVAGSGVLPRRAGPAALAAGGLDRCGRARRVRHDGGWPVPVPVRRSARAAGADRRSDRLTMCKVDYAASVKLITPMSVIATPTHLWMSAYCCVVSGLFAVGRRVTVGSSITLAA